MCHFGSASVPLLSVEFCWDSAEKAVENQILTNASDDWWLRFACAT